jgi:hypothetical protein
MVKNLAQQGVINLSGVRPQLAKGPTKTLQDQTEAPVNFIPVYLACVCVLRFIRWFWLSAPILRTITADNGESTVYLSPTANGLIPGDSVYIPRHRKFKRLKLGGGQTFKCLDCRCNVSYIWWSMICCIEPGLTRPCIYYIYIKCVTCKMGDKKYKINKTWRWAIIADSN